MKSDLSIVIITLNEAERLRECLASLPPEVETIVLDSYSQDETVKIAEEFGAKVYFRKFTNFAEQKNAACGYATKNWIFSMDADETMDPELAYSLSRMDFLDANKKNQISAFKVKRQLHFLGQPMRFGKTTDYPIRLFAKDSGAFQFHVHEAFQSNTPGNYGKISGRLWHRSYKDLSDYFSKFNTYTSKVSQQHFLKQHRPSFGAHCFRFWGEFLSRYVLRLGFLDGYHGYTYALISSLYAYIKYAKYFELVTKEQDGQST